MTCRSAAAAPRADGRRAGRSDAAGHTATAAARVRLPQRDRFRHVRGRERAVAIETTVLVSGCAQALAPARQAQGIRSISASAASSASTAAWYPDLCRRRGRAPSGGAAPRRSARPCRLRIVCPSPMGALRPRRRVRSAPRARTARAAPSPLRQRALVARHDRSCRSTIRRRSAGSRDDRMLDRGREQHVLDVDRARGRRANPTLGIGTGNRQRSAPWLPPPRCARPQGR